MRIPPRSLALALVASGVLAISTRARAEDAPPPPPDDGKTEVHILAVSTVTLEQLVDGEWVEVCHAPCDERLRVDAKYRTHGNGFESSKPFSLVSRNGSAVIEVTPRSDRGHAVGMALLVTGAVLLPLGLVTMGLGIASETFLTLLEMATCGLAATTGGLALLIAGASVLDSRRPSKVTQLSDAAAANVRSPTWTTGPERAPSSATSLVVPILSGTF